MFLPRDKTEILSAIIPRSKRTAKIQKSISPENGMDVKYFKNLLLK